MEDENKKLPKELLDKFTPLLETYKRGNNTGYVQQKCAQIAVEYTGDIQKRNTVLSFKNKDLYNENFSLKQQRDELFEVLRGLVRDVGDLICDHDIEWQQAGYYEHSKQLLKKQEDPIKMKCLEYYGILNEPHAKCTKCGKEEWQHKI